MNILKSIFRAKETPIRTYNDFWNWFRNNERTFYKVLKENKDVEKNFFNKLSHKLNELNDGFFYEAGMFDNNTAELIISASGIIKNLASVEQLIASAPRINGWKFTALKPARDMKGAILKLGGYEFTLENMHFCVIEDASHPDEINISIIYDKYNWNDDYGYYDEGNKSAIESGVYLFLDNYLGELNFAMVIDNLTISGQKDANQNLMKIEKLEAYLKWRQSEFIEKHQGIRHNTENDQHSILEAYHEDGSPVIGIINTDLLKWDSKASHPWVMKIEIPYQSGIGNGMPDDTTCLQLDEIESDIVSELKDSDGYLYIGRVTSKNVRELFFACIDFRKPSILLEKIQKQYVRRFSISFVVYKDKYWRSFKFFETIQ